ncbi:hypothetical protein GRX01_10165 [Halobaculum sp. WSA2]|uniref:Metallo-beta-lactamase domain-containing protein n=1 Tax=Halobaculum saliterrae TaxID=2073113 RepID=A0A6B0T0E6_9EURY|nr:MBL fold metallo-hydrolase [Halobaculum saliterrae]MXR41700.1 hypothetical protein [Halobaculum saliterrae]
MRVRFLGTGGSQPIPLPTCDCRLCREARRTGPPVARRGSELFLPGIAGLVDASEFAPRTLSESGIRSLEYCFLTHWHADHAGGLRVLGMRPADPGPGETVSEAKARTAPTLVTTRPVYERARESVGVVGHYVDTGVVDLHLLDGDEAGPLRTDGWRVDALPYPLEPGSGIEDATGFLFDDGDATLAVVADDARGLPAASLPADLDAVVFESGYLTRTPDGDRHRDPTPGEGDLSHPEILDRVRRVDPDAAFLSHIGHHYGWSHAQLTELAGGADYEDVTFAHDGLVVDV